MKTVLFISPGYPSEMPDFVRGLAEVGVQVFGLGDQPGGALPPMTQHALSDYLQVESLWDEAKVVEEVQTWLGTRRVDRVECLWEVGMLLAAKVRAAVGASGLTVEQTIPFRNKEAMKRKLDQAGIRVPRHTSAKGAKEIRAKAERIGFPLILKPIAGAGSADTHRINDSKELERAIKATKHQPEMSVEEFIDGEEYTFDTVSINGVPQFFNIAWYRPRPLVARSYEWLSPQVVALRHPEAPELNGGVAMGHAVLRALEFESGFTHMEWYLKADGDVVFGEIGGRPPGAHQVDQMNYSCDIDVFRGWAEAVALGTYSEPSRRLYNVATIYKRARGEGRIHSVEGYQRFLRHYGETIVWDNLLPIGAHRRDWLQTLVSDGFMMLRHPHFETTLAIADDFSETVTMLAE